MGSVYVANNIVRERFTIYLFSPEDVWEMFSFEILSRFSYRNWGTIWYEVQVITANYDPICLAQSHSTVRNIEMLLVAVMVEPGKSVESVAVDDDGDYGP